MSDTDTERMDAWLTSATLWGCVDAVKDFCDFPYDAPEAAQTIVNEWRRFLAALVESFADTGFCYVCRGKGEHAYRCPASHLPERKDPDAERARLCFPTESDESRFFSPAPAMREEEGAG